MGRLTTWLVGSQPAETATTNAGKDNNNNNKKKNANVKPQKFKMSNMQQQLQRQRETEMLSQATQITAAEKERILTENSSVCSGSSCGKSSSSAGGGGGSMTDSSQRSKSSKKSAATPSKGGGKFKMSQLQSQLHQKRQAEQLTQAPKITAEEKHRILIESAMEMHSCNDSVSDISMSDMGDLSESSIGSRSRHRLFQQKRAQMFEGIISVCSNESSGGKGSSTGSASGDGGSTSNKSSNSKSTKKSTASSSQKGKFRLGNMQQQLQRQRQMQMLLQSPKITAAEKQRILNNMDGIGDTLSDKDTASDRDTMSDRDTASDRDTMSDIASDKDTIVSETDAFQAMLQAFEQVKTAEKKRPPGKQQPNANKFKMSNMQQQLQRQRYMLLQPAQFAPSEQEPSQHDGDSRAENRDTTRGNDSIILKEETVHRGVDDPVRRPEIPLGEFSFEKNEVFVPQKEPDLLLQVGVECEPPPEDRSRGPPEKSEFSFDNVFAPQAAQSDLQVGVECAPPLDPLEDLAARIKASPDPFEEFMAAAAAFAKQSRAPPKPRPQRRKPPVRQKLIFGRPKRRRRSAYTPEYVRWYPLEPIEECDEDDPILKDDWSDTDTDDCSSSVDDDYADDCSSSGSVSDGYDDDYDVKVDSTTREVNVHYSGVLSPSDSEFLSKFSERQKMMMGREQVQ